MEPQMAGLLGGILGGVIGLSGAALGTYASLHNARNAAEYRFLLRASAALWLSTFLLVVLPIGLVAAGRLSASAYWGLWVVYMACALMAIPWMNRRAEALAQAGALSKPSLPPDDRL